MKDFIDTGVFAMGIGSALYKPGKTLAQVSKSASEFVTTYKKFSYQS